MLDSMDFFTVAVHCTWHHSSSLLWWSSSREPDLTPASNLRAFLHNGMHVIAYGGLCGAFLLWLDPAPTIGDVRWGAAGLSWLLSVAYGIVDEVHQSFVPGRVCSVVDVLSDAFGAALAIALLGSCLSRSRVCNVALGACLVGSFASVAMATWGPW